MARRTFPKDAGERVSLQARTTSAVRDRLEEAAARSGRSLSQEMEMRLEQSLQIEDVAAHAIQLANERTQGISDMMGGPETFTLLRDLALIIEFVETDMGEPWHKNGETKAKLLRSLEAVLPAAIRAQSGPGEIKTDPLWRAVEMAKYLPFKPVRKEPPPLPEGVRLMTQEELKHMFYRRYE